MSVAIILSPGQKGIMNVPANYQIRVLHGMSDQTLQAIYRSVVVAKILYASSAWWGFTTATDQQRIDAFFGQSKRCGFCPSDLPAFDEQCVAADDKLLKDILLNTSHILHCLLPPPTVASQNYNLRHRAHNRTLPKHSGQLADSNFLNRALYMNIF